MSADRASFFLLWLLFALGWPWTSALATCDSVIWSRALGGPLADFGDAVAANSDGGSFIAGRFRGTIDLGGGALHADSTFGHPDLFLVRLGPAGQHVWSRAFGGPYDEAANAVTATPTGGVIVSGYFSHFIDLGGGPLPSYGDNDIFVAEFDATGQLVWSRSYGGPFVDRSYGASILTDDDIAITGIFSGTVDFGTGPVTSVSELAAFVLRLGPDGTCRWTRAFSGLTYETDLVEGRAVTSTLDGGILSVGSFSGSADFGNGPETAAAGSDGFAVKLDGAGSFLWSRIFSPTGDYAWCFAVAPLPGSGAVAGGLFKGTMDLGGPPLPSVGLQDAFLIALEADGSSRWSSSFGGLGDDRVSSVATTTAGEVVISGLFNQTADLGGGPLTSQGDSDIYVLKLNASGDHAWSRSFGGPDRDSGAAIAVHADGRSTLVGTFEGSMDLGGWHLSAAGASDAVVMRLDADGGWCGFPLKQVLPLSPTDTSHTTAGVWLDVDWDSDFDLLALRHGNEPGSVYLNGALGFSNTTWSPLTTPGGLRGADCGDHDNDGDVDLYVVDTSGPNRLFRNDGGGGFVDIAGYPIALGFGDQGATWLDYDLDGLLDIYLTTLTGPNHLFRNLGAGAFVDVTPPALEITAECPTSAWGDFDGDGDSDAYISVAAGPNALVRNDGGGTFTDVTQPPLNDGGTGQGVAWGDYDNDGDLDLYLCNFGQPNRLFRNDGGGAFVDVATGPLADPNQGQSGTWADFDNDRDLDLVLTNFGQPSYLLRNDGGNSFVPVATVGDTTRSLGASWGDCDRDGDEDLLIANFGSADRLYRNDQATGNRWLEIALVGTASNRSAHGTRIVLVDLASGTTQMREHGSNHGFWSVNAPVVHFGLGTAAQADALVVRWPSGAQEIFQDVLANQRITIVEGGGIVSAPPIAAGAGLAVRSHPNPFRDATVLHLSGGVPKSVEKLA